MKKTIVKTAAACGLCLTLLATTSFASAAFGGNMNRMNNNGMAPNQQTAMFGGMRQGGQMNGRFGGMQTAPTAPTGGQQGGTQTAPTAPMGGQQGGMQTAPTAPMGGQQSGTQTAPTAPTGGQQSGTQTAPTAPTGGQQSGTQTAPTAPTGQQPTDAQSSTGSATEVAEGLTTNSAADLEADYANAVTYDVSEGSVKIKSAGTYIVTGTSSDANITVTKGTTGVVLVLKDLDLTSTEGAAVSINKTAEAKIIISGSVKLTDAEDPADETSTDEAVADAFDGAAIKVKANASAYITGTGTLTITGTAKNGIKAGDETVLVIDGPTVNITATNDAINGNYDVAILSGKLTISAGDDAIHADRILTVGSATTSPTVTITKSYEGIEATVVNLVSGTINVTSTDDGVNAANSDGAYASELAYSINVTGANVTVSAPRADGLDSNGNINLISGSATINSANNGGDAGLDYDGSLYISDAFNLNNNSGVAEPDGMGGMMGGFGGQMGSQMGGQQSGFGRMGR